MGRCLAIVSHELMNAHLGDDPNAIEALAALEELGYGMMALPPATQPASLEAEALDQLVDQLQDYVRHGYAAVIVESSPAEHVIDRLETACHSRGVATPRRIRSGADVRVALEALRRSS
jgi:hypothetical protein